MTTIYTMKEFEQEVGSFKWNEKRFERNSGGASDPDSFRGFGPTEQYWDVPTEAGWTVWYGDNGAGIQAATSPKGEEYVRSHRMITTSSTVRPQRSSEDVMRPAEQHRLKTIVVEWQEGHYAGSISKFDLFSKEEEEASVAYAVAHGLPYRFE